jgi:hypothetical protein
MKDFAKKTSTQAEQSSHQVLVHEMYQRVRKGHKRLRSYARCFTEVEYRSFVFEPCWARSNETWSARMSLSLWPRIYLFAWHLTVWDRCLMPCVYAQHAKPASRAPRSGLRGMGQCPIPSHIWGWYRTGNTVPTGAGQSRRQLQPVRCPALRSMMGMGPM